MIFSLRQLLVATLASIAVLLVACGGGDDAEPTPEPSPPPTATPPRTPWVTPLPNALPGTGYRFLYREPGETQDIIWRINAADITQKEQVGSIPHSPGCYSTSSISPDGRFLFYLSQPPELPCDPTLSRAQAFQFDMALGETIKVADGVDLRFKPLWTSDSRLVYIRRYAGFEILGSRVSVLYVPILRKLLPGEPTPTPTPTPSPTPTIDPAATPIPTVDPNLPPPPTVDPRLTPTPTPEPGTTIMTETFAHTNAFIPLGIGADGRSLLFVQLPGGTGGPTLLGEYTPATFDAIVEEQVKASAAAAALGTQTPDPAAPPTPSPTPNAKLVTTLTNETPLSFAISPDGTKVAFTTQGIVDGEFVERAYWVDVATRTITPMALDGLSPPLEGFVPVWHPDNARVAIGMRPFGVDPGVVTLIPYPGGPSNALAGADDAGYDQPLAWAGDGTYLAVRHIVQGPSRVPESVRMEFVSSTGQRVVFAEGPNFEAVGWYAVPPPPGGG